MSETSNQQRRIGPDNCPIEVTIKSGWTLIKVDDVAALATEYADERASHNEHMAELLKLEAENKWLREALEDISTDGIAVEEATHEELCQFIASMKRKIDKALEVPHE